jgi:hypothetical protein
MGLRKPGLASDRPLRRRTLDARLGEPRQPPGVTSPRPFMPSPPIGEIYRLAPSEGIHHGRSFLQSRGPTKTVCSNFERTE